MKKEGNMTMTYNNIEYTKEKQLGLYSISNDSFVHSSEKLTSNTIQVTSSVFHNDITNLCTHR